MRVHLRRLTRAPRVEADGDELVIHGLVCSVCASRTRAALLSVPGVRSGEVDLDRGRARLRFDPGDRPDVATLQHALEGVVIGLTVRRVIERGVSRITRFVMRVRGAASCQQTSA